jgi:hypothetical protein
LGPDRPRHAFDRRHRQSDEPQTRDRRHCPTARIHPAIIAQAAAAAATETLVVLLGG